MTDITYTQPSDITGHKVTATPNYGRTVSGYGAKIPTRYIVRMGNRWHRVYMMQYGNSGSAYIISGGVDLFLDTDTEHVLQAIHLYR